MNEEKNVKLRWFGIPRLIPYMTRYKKTILWMIVTPILTHS